MAINKKLIHYNKEEDFLKDLNAGNIKTTSIVWIKDIQKIFTHNWGLQGIPEGGAAGQILYMGEDKVLRWVNFTDISDIFVEDNYYTKEAIDSLLNNRTEIYELEVSYTYNAGKFDVTLATPKEECAKIFAEMEGKDNAVLVLKSEGTRLYPITQSYGSNVNTKVITAYYLRGAVAEFGTAIDDNSVEVLSAAISPINNAIYGGGSVYKYATLATTKLLNSGVYSKQEVDNKIANIDFPDNLYLLDIDIVENPSGKLDDIKLTELREAIDANKQIGIVHTIETEGGTVITRELYLSSHTLKSSADDIQMIFPVDGITIKLEVNQRGTYTTESDQYVTTDNFFANMNSKADEFTLGNGLEWEYKHSSSSDDDDDDIIGRELKVTLDNKPFIVVDKLPGKPAEGNENKIHLVLKENTSNIMPMAVGEGVEEPVQVKNIFDEYLWANGDWEKLGEFETKIDLSEYVKTKDIQNIIDDFNLCTIPNGIALFKLSSGISGANLIGIINKTQTSVYIRSELSSQIRSSKFKFYVVLTNGIFPILDLNTSSSKSFSIIAHYGSDVYKIVFAFKEADILMDRWDVINVIHLNPSLDPINEELTQLKEKVDSTPSFWTGTQDEYDKLSDKDENTFYFIKEEV